MRKTIISWSLCAAVILPALGASSAMADVASDPQSVGQVAGSQQAATSTATSTQHQPINQNIAVAILSPGAGMGNVTQSNSSSATSAAGNQNGTGQSATQNGGGGVQGVLQGADSSQSASSAATSTQYEPSNQNIEVAILSPGAGSGNVNQSNSSSANSAAGNQNGTGQSATQNAAGTGGVQAAAQEAGNRQSAGSSATSTQDHPSNRNIDVTILGHKMTGSGNVSQSNSSVADSKAGNQNGTTQSATQNAGGGGLVLERCLSCDGGSNGPAVQSIGQLAKNDQSAGSSATSTQDHPSNTNIPVAIFSPGANGGSVSQSNSSVADSKAGNQNGTTQSATQNAGGGGLVLERCLSCDGGSNGPAVQSIGQLAKNDQSAGSSATSTQDHPSNTNIPVAIFSPGANGGSVSQSNSSVADSKAGNQNGTTQSATQNAGGGGLVLERCLSCDGGSNGPAVQSIGQLAKNDQSAGSSATSTQDHPSNTNIPVAIFSPGANGGSVSQSNSSVADSKAGNQNGTTQSATQNAGGGGLVLERCLSCDGGSYGPAVQSIGQAVDSHQDATSSATSTQAGASNVNLPVTLGAGMDRYGKDGGCCERPASMLEVAPAPVPTVSQSNSSSAGSMAGNQNGTNQTATQSAGHASPMISERCVPTCGGYYTGPVVQSIGQAAYNGQSARSAATSDQWCPTNVSFGTLGDLRQWNGSRADSQAGNRNGTTQRGTQNSGALFAYPVMS